MVGPDLQRSFGMGALDKASWHNCKNSLVPVTIMQLVEMLSHMGGGDKTCLVCRFGFRLGNTFICKKSYSTSCTIASSLNLHHSWIFTIFNQKVG